LYLELIRFGCFRSLEKVPGLAVQLQKIKVELFQSNQKPITTTTTNSFQRLRYTQIQTKMPSVATPTKAGIITDTTGERHIPSSVRPDGSIRKEIKIKPGYKPPEDVEVYKNRTAETWKSRGSGGIPGAAGLKDDEPTGSAASNKNAKRREARKKAKAAEDGTTQVKGSDEGASSKNWRKGDEVKEDSVVDVEAEKEKKARNLKKKLKQAKDLKEKKDGGSALLPEQFAKVIKINELIRELDALGFDAEGEQKTTSES